MPGLDSPVCFARAAPFNVSSRQLVFYDVIDVNITSKCSVLSCIAEGGGEARLPDAITLSDFEQWMSAVEDTREDAGERSFPSICILAKVADAVDAEDVDEWIDLAADSLFQHTLPNSCKGDIHEVDQSLSLLSESLQYRILGAAASDASRLYSLLDFLPSHHHLALLAATITPGKSLQAPLNSKQLSVLQLLTALPSSPASVLALHAHDHKVKTSLRDEADARTQSLDVAQHLVKALRHHSGIISLSLSSFYIDDASLKLLFSAIATLTSLQSLQLGAKENSIPAEGMAMLQQVLPLLPHLRGLTVHLCGIQNGAVAKRPRDEDAAPEPPCLTTALSPATGLTSLHLHITEARGFFSATALLTLPHLEQLAAVFTVRWQARSLRLLSEPPIAEVDQQLTTAFISRLSAPLTSLKLTGEKLPALPRSSDVGARRFLSSLVKFPQLRCLAAALPGDGGGSASGMTASRAPAVLASLQHLQDLSIGAECPVLHQAMPLLGTALKALTGLQLQFGGSRIGGDFSWPDFFSHLCRFKLQNLDLHLSGCIGGSETGLAAMRPLIPLTALRISHWGCLSSAEDCNALARMTSLERLELCEVIDHHTSHADAVRALLALSALTSLTANACCSQFDGALVAGVAAQPPEEAWPALQRLSLHVEDALETAEDVVRNVVKLPAVNELTLVLSHHDFEDDCHHRSAAFKMNGYSDRMGALDAFVEEAIGKLSSVESSVKAIAVKAGLELKVNWDSGYL